MMFKKIASFFTITALLTGVALAQGLFSFQLQPSTLVGNLRALPGPGQQIPLATLTQAVGASQASGATANQIPVFPGSNGAAVPTSGTTWFDNAYCNTVGFVIARLAGAWTCAQQIPIPVTWFSGVLCNGSNDDTSGIQTIINGLPNDGGELLIQSGQNCKITSTLNIGNGTTSVVSTKRGVVIRGVGNPNTPAGSPIFSGYSVTGGPKLTWAGGASTMVQINGPLQGWGIKNLFLDCASVSGTIGIQVVSASLGDSENLAIQNCAAHGIASTTNPLGGYSGVGNVDSFRNNWTDISILVPAIASAKGLTLTGEAAGSSSTDYNNFTNIFIRTPGGVANFGFYIANTDSNNFTNIAATGFSGGGVGMTFDYGGAAGFPTSNIFTAYEIQSFSTLGTPSTAATNKFYGWLESNGAPVPTIGGTYAIDGAWVSYTSGAACGTATFTAPTAKGKRVGKTAYFEADIQFATIGTCTQTLTVNLPFAANSSGGATGREVAAQFKGINCAIVGAAATTAQCVISDLSAFSAASRAIFSGTYEVQ